MKGLLVILLLSSFACSRNVVISEEEIVPDVFYAYGSYAPFTGKCSVVAKNTSLVLEELSYDKGHLEGMARFWYKNGNMKKRGTFHHGLLSGKWEYWDENGNKLGEAIFIDDHIVSLTGPPR
jgi:antitoxin component YwqK of YwqJK toxin-antitoxin module